MLFSRAALLFGIETTPGTAVAVTAADAMLVEEPNYTADLQQIERNFAKGDISPFPFMIGRRLGQVSFRHEIRSNGKATGLTADAPRLARLMRACGFQIVAASTAAERIFTYSRPTNVGTATFAKGGTLTNTQAAVFDIAITTAGNAATARATVSCNNPTVQAAPVTNVSLSAAVTLGNTGATVTPTIPGNLSVGDRFTVVVLPMGVRAVPVTDGFETATIEVYYDGIRHRLTGAVGSFSFSADAGGTVMAEFTFMGVHNPVVDAAFPTGLAFEETLPALFQNALVTHDTNANLIIKSMSFDLGLQSGTRDDANHPEGFRGYQLQTRAPMVGINPEGGLQANNPVWDNFTAARQLPIHARIGDTVGNMITLFGPRSQIGSVGYTDANNRRTYELSLMLAREVGNDEVMFHFG